MKKLFKRVRDFGGQYLPIKISKEDKVFLLVFVCTLFVSISLTYYAGKLFK
jgi:hypothetical protein